MATLELIARFGADTKGLEKGTKKAADSLNKLSDEAKKAEKSAAQSRKALKQFGIVALGTAIAVGVKSIKAFAKFEKGMAEVGTLTKFTAKEMRGMSKETLKMAQTFGQNIGTLTKARYDAVSAGFSDITEQTQLLTQANQLAIAGVTDVGTAMDGLTSVVNAYGKEVITAEQASDILFATVQAGKTTIPELNAALGKVLPTAKGAGVAFEEIGAALATLTAAGISTPQAVTALNSAIFALSAPTKDAAANLKDMKIQTTDAAGSMLPLVDVVGQFEGLSLAEIRKVIPDKEAAKAILAAANNMDIFRENTERLANVAGVTQEAYEKMAQTTAQRLAIVNSSFEVLKTTFGAFIADNRSGVNVLGATTAVLNDWTRLLSLDTQGVSGLRTEWQMFVQDTTGTPPGQQGLIDLNLALLNAVTGFDLIQAGAEEAAKAITGGAKDTAINIKKIDEQNLKSFEFFVKNRLEAGEQVFSNDVKIQKRISEIQKQLASENLAAFKKSATDIAGTFDTLLTTFKSQVSSDAPEAAKPISRSFSKEGQTVASGFSQVVSSMSSTAQSGLSGAFAPLTSSMGSAMSSASAQFNAMIARLRANATINVRVNVSQTSGGATGGFVFPGGVIGMAAGGLAPSDTVPAMLTPGEFVVRKSSVQGNESALAKLNTTGGFALGGMVQGFQRGGAVAGGVEAGGQRQAGGALDAFATETFLLNQEAQAEANERRAEAQLTANENFLEMMEEFQQGITDIQLAKMDEREQLFFERQEALSAILQGPFSEEQKELLVENANAFFDAQLQAIEEDQSAELEKEKLEERLANIKKFQQTAGKSFGKFFSSQISGQKSFNQASEALFKEGLTATIDAIVNKKIAEIGVVQAAEVGKALLEGPGTFGASLAKIPLILAAGAAAKAAIGGIKFHEGGIVGGDINAPPRDVPAVLQTGERVVSREETQAAAESTPMIEVTIPLILEEEEIGKAMARIRPGMEFS